MITVIIPAFKNTDELVNNVRQNLKYLKNCQIIIVNDDPTKSIAQEIKIFPEIELIENKKNLGFGKAINVGVQHARYRYVILLNSDVLLMNDSFKIALGRFRTDPNLFAVSFAQKEHNGQVVGKNRISFINGVVQHTQAHDLTLGITAWAEGGTCMIDKEKFVVLGGFDRLYAPFYWEDIDLSYNAWKSGYKVLFDPNILVEHHHESTIGKYFQIKKIKTISYRNQLIFTWKNISDKNYCLSHALHLPLMKISMLVKGEVPFLIGLLQASGKIPQIFASRLQVKKHWKLHDREIFSQFS